MALFYILWLSTTGTANISLYNLNLFEVFDCRQTLSLAVAKYSDDCVISAGQAAHQIEHRV